MKLKYVLLFVTLILLIELATASATQSDDNTTTTKTITQPDTANYESTDYAKTDTTKQINTDETQNTDTKSTTKQIRKNTQTTTTKQATQPLTVTNYDELSSALTSGDYKDLTVDLKGESDTYTSSGTINVNSAIKNLTINGNNKTIDGASQRFLYIKHSLNITLNNITVKNCKYDATTYSYGFGGGAIYISTSCNVTINESKFENNELSGKYGYWGGALYLYDYYKSTLTILNSNFTDNIALKSGGAIYHAGSLYINNSRFQENKGTTSSSDGYGGAICQGTNSKLIINNSCFIENSAYTGGAIKQSENGEITIFNSNFTSNQAITWGGAIRNDKSKSLIINNSNFTLNKALGTGASTNTKGGAVYASNDLELNDCTFKYNKAFSGAAIHVDCQIVVNKCEFIENNASAGSAISQPTTHSRTSNIIINNTNFTKNRASSYGTIHTLSTSGKVSVENSNFNENWGDQYSVLDIRNGNENNISYCNFTGNTVNKYGIINAGTGNITINNSNLTRNYAGYASIIQSSGSIKLDNNTFDSNWIGSTSLKEYIIQFDNPDSKVVNNTFVNNTNNKRDMLINTLVNEIHDNKYIDNYLNDTLEVASESITENYEKKVNIDLRNVYNDTIRNGTLEIYINDNTELYRKSEVENGVTTMKIAYDDLPLVKNTITAKYVTRSKHYQNITKTFILEKEPIKTNITVSCDEEVKVGNTILIEGDLFEAKDASKVIPQFNVQLYINNTLITTNKTDSNGHYKFYYKTSVVGTQNVRVNFTEQGFYAACYNTTSFKVLPLATNMTIMNNNSIKVGQSVTIHGTLTDESNNIVPNTHVNIAIKRYAKIINVQVDSNGKYSITQQIDKVGTFTITVEYKNHATKYTSSTNTSSVTVNPRNTNMTINNNRTIKTGQKVTINGTLYDELGYKVTNTKVNIIIQGYPKIENVKVDDTGQYTATQQIDKAGTYTITVEYKNHTTKYTSSTNTSSVTVTAISTNMTITATNVIIGQNTAISGTLHDEYNKPVGNTKLSISVDGKVINNSVTVDSSGKYHITYKASSVGKHNVLVTFTGDANYIGSANTTTFTVTPRNSHIIINAVNSVKVGQKVTITGTLMDSLGETIKNTYVNITVNGATIFNVPVDSKGNYKATYTTTLVGQNNVLVTYNNNTTNYTGSTNKTTFTVNPLGTNSTISVNNVLVDQYATISGTLHDEYGNPIPNTKVSLRVDNNYIKDDVNVDSNGKYKVSYNATGVGQHTIKIIYTSTSAKYTSSINTTTFRATSRNTILTIKNDKTAKVGVSTTISGSLSDELGEPVAYAKVSIKIGDKTINAVTDEKGKFTATTAISSTGLQTITVTYNNQSSKYAGSKKTSSITVNPRSTRISIDNIGTVPANSKVTISGVLTDEVGEKVVNTKVTVNVNKNVYNNIAVDKNGKYSLVYRADTVGTNKVTVTYKNTTTYYTGSSNTATFKVTQLGSSLKLDSLKPAKANDTSVVSGTLKDSKGNPITKATVKVVLNNEKTVYATTDSNGKFTAKFASIASGLNNFTVVYAGNNIYKSSSAKISQNVTKKAAVLTVDNLVGTLGEKIKLTVHATDTKGKKITGGNIVFKLNGKTLRVDGSFNSSKSPLKISVVNGLATTNIIGNLNIRNTGKLTAAYSGNSIYDKADSNTATVNIRKRDAKITVTTNIRMVKQNRNIVFKASVTDITKNHKNKTSINQDGYVFFKVNGNTLKDKSNNIILVKVKNGKANYTYHVPTGTGGIDNNKNIRNYTVTAVYTNEYFYPDAKATTTYNVERSPITIKITSAKVSKGIVSIKGTIKDYEGNYVIGKNKVCVKINGATYKEGGKYKYFTVVNGKIDLTGINAKDTKEIKSITIVAGERQAYLGGRATTTKIKS